MNRREWLIGLAGGAAAAAVAVAGCGSAALAPGARADAEFYFAPGKFNDGAAKKAYLAFLDRKGYPISRNLRQNLWVTDFGLGKFTEAGMGGLAWVNDKEQGYFAHELFLLPGQMVPEHQHLKSGDVKAKMEVWHVRYGWIYLFGEGDPTPGAAALVPPGQKGLVTALNERIVKAGEVAGIAKPEEKHWLLAGPEGAIVSEYGTYHDPKAIRFTNPKVRF